MITVLTGRITLHVFLRRGKENGGGEEDREEKRKGGKNRKEESLFLTGRKNK